MTWPSVFKSGGSRKIKKVSRARGIEEGVVSLIEWFFYHVTYLGIWGYTPKFTSQSSQKTHFVLPTLPSFFTFSFYLFDFSIHLHIMFQLLLQLYLIQLFLMYVHLMFILLLRSYTIREWIKQYLYSNLK